MLKRYDVKMKEKRNTINNKELLANDRRRKILELIQENGSAKVKDLSRIFELTEPTIRQDLERLETDGHIIREHGGAYLRSISQQVKNLSLQHNEHLAMKQEIAARALEYIDDSDTLILDSGSTVSALAEMLGSKANLTIITNALNIALAVGTKPGYQLMVTGGEFKPPTLSLTGEKAAVFFKNIYVNKLFLATGGISNKLELTYPGFSDLEVKRSMVHAAEETYVLADSSKFGKTSFASLGIMDFADYLITNKDASADMCRRIEALGTKIIYA